MSKFKEIINAIFGRTPSVLPTKDIKEIEPKNSKLAIPKPGLTAYANVPPMWSWLLSLEGRPKIISEALKEYGTLEGTGTLNNKKIINWADEVAQCHPTTYTNWAADWYNADSVPWCGLFMAVIACRAANSDLTRMPPPNYLSSLAWAAFGKTVDWKTSLNNIWMGDVAIFVREGGGHVASVVGVSKDGQYIVCLGGNQDDKVDIKMISASRLYAVRRPPYHVRPISARHFRINSSGINVSTNER
jgi:uncharacterized protein (TIGR02594 family)